MRRYVETRFRRLRLSVGNPQRVDLGQGMTPETSDPWLRKGIIARGGCKAFAPSPYAGSKRGNDANVHDIHVRTARSACVKIETDRRSPAFGRERTGTYGNGISTGDLRA